MITDYTKNHSNKIDNLSFLEEVETCTNLKLTDNLSFLEVEVTCTKPIDNLLFPMEEICTKKCQIML
jgi:hypothetical protein